MPDTYDTAAEAEADRTQQKALLAALNGWNRALRRDECGAWRITGSRLDPYMGRRQELGSLCWLSVGDVLDLHEAPACVLAHYQDGDGEGCLHLQQLPTAEQAEVIRDVLGIRKRVELGPDELERRRALING